MLVQFLQLAEYKTQLRALVVRSDAFSGSLECNFVRVFPTLRVAVSWGWCDLQAFEGLLDISTSYWISGYYGIVDRWRFSHSL